MILKRTAIIVLTLGILGCLAVLALAGAPADPPLPGPYGVTQKYFEWTDPARQRQVPLKMYLPQDAPGPWPVVMFSHGLGGSRDGFGYLAKHWASHGYLVVHPQHLGSDASLWQGKIKPMGWWNLWRAAREPENLLNRPLDVSFVISRLQELNRDGAWQGRLDLGHLAVAGHSFGALTSLLLAGQVLSGPRGALSLADPRPQAFIAMSPPVPRQEGGHGRAYANIALPGLHLSGSLDQTRLGVTQAEQRRVPYDRIRLADQYLLFFDGADHRSFLGHPAGPGRPERDPRFHQLIKLSTTAFLDAYLKKDPTALAWLGGGGMKRALGADGVWEMKTPGQVK
jgi:predicted dienelactone hydrolase